MRAEMTPPERELWFALRAKRFADVKFARQVVIGPYIVDFVARSRKLIIEVDGDSHGVQERYDARRTAWLEEQGYRVIRFTNSDVLTNLEGVLYMVANSLVAAPLPTLSPEGRGLFPS
jgi:very-short-patch-repair endonuclease